MKNSLSHAIHDAILRVAGLLVPTEHHNRCLEQWHSELLHVQRCFFPGRTFWQSPIGFCLGAFPDAMWMRNNAGRASLRFSSPIRSPLICIATLALLASI